MQPHQFWQTFEPAAPIEAVFGSSFPALLPDRQILRLPIRVLPGDGARAVASLIVNQASFAVLDGLAEFLAGRLRPHEPEIVVGVPTLGLPLAEQVARRLGHARMVALGTSRKFWYQDDLSAPMSSITSPGQEKRLYLDPRMLPLLEGRRTALVDDVISTGTSIRAALAVLSSAGLAPIAIGAAMLQTERWRGLGLDMPVVGVFETPLLERTEAGWVSHRD